MKRIALSLCLAVGSVQAINFKHAAKATGYTTVCVLNSFITSVCLYGSLGSPEKEPDQLNTISKALTAYGIGIVGLTGLWAGKEACKEWKKTFTPNKEKLS